MIVTIHQPNFAPWTGFFDKMRQADVFVLLDTVPFSKGSYGNRVQIQGGTWLTVPVLTKGRSGQLTCDVETNETRPWRSDHLKTIQSRYARAPHLADVLSLLEATYEAQQTRLADLCCDLLQRTVDYLGWSTPLVRASTLAARGSSGQLLADIVAELGGDTYLSGPSGRTYLDESLFTGRGIGVSYHSFTPPPYDQGGRPFEPRLSILDQIAWCGPDPV
ncbi:MAG: WbqC family protein [Actinomycetia bacterium]|nr:WbqC family protein [Actinomycetes bacterium]